MKLKNITIALGLASLLFSCQKLDQEPLDAFNADNFWKTEAEADFAINGLYSGTTDANGKMNEGTAWENGTQIFYMDCTSDNSNNDFVHEGFQVLGNGTVTPTNSGNAGSRYSYEHIRRANYILENIDKAPMAAEKRKRLIAEVRVIRAYRYFDMATLFGGVPIITKTLAKEDAYLPANTQKEVFDFVEKELKEAAADLSFAKGGARMTKGAALGLLARCYAFQKKHQEVINTTEEIISSDNYKLFADYATLFEEINENNNEVIMNIEYLANVQPYTMLGIMLPNSMGGWGSIVPTQSLVDAYETTEGKTIVESTSYNPANPYENRDARLGATIVYPGALYNEKYFDPLNPASKDYPSSADNASNTAYNYKKYIQKPKTYIDFWNVGTNIIVMRYAEILLLNAEAKIELGKIDKSVYENIDLVRERAKMPKVDKAVYAEQGKLRELVRREFRVELAGEGRRRFDIIRWGIAKDVMNGPVYGGLSKGSVDPKTGKVTYTSLTDRFFVENRTFKVDKNELWPIPQAVIDNSKGTLKQNPGY